MLAILLLLMNTYIEANAASDANLCIQPNAALTSCVDKSNAIKCSEVKSISLSAKTVKSTWISQCLVSPSIDLSDTLVSSIETHLQMLYNFLKQRCDEKTYERECCNQFYYAITECEKLRNIVSQKNMQIINIPR